jgi:hypothetical protein
MSNSIIVIVSFALAFILGRIGSVLLYQTTWKNGITRKFHSCGALFTFLTSPWPWFLHLPIIVFSSIFTWNDLPNLYVFICVVTGFWSLAAIGRIGAVDLGCMFMIDRVIVLILWLGLLISPVFLYPLLLACCCLQYIVSSSSWSPGYSNLLGFEFMRNTLCLCLASLMVKAGMEVLTKINLIVVDNNFNAEFQIFAVILCGQAASYVPQAVAKSAIGNRWYSWIFENRLQCLVVNAHLRGWCASWVKTSWVLTLAKGLSHIRVLLCFVSWLIEISWLLILIKPELTLVILYATIVFHLSIWFLIGFISYHYIISHTLMLILLPLVFSQVPFKLEYILTGGCCILLSSIWVLLLRRNIYKEFNSPSKSYRWVNFVDPADHLMSWWDGPYMRMYSYIVKTISGKQFYFPVTHFSPYDTFLTNIHTHLMILGKNWALDPKLDADRTLACVGVWGLIFSKKERDKLYFEMDKSQKNVCTNKLNTIKDQNVNITIFNQRSIDFSELQFIKFFQGLNHYRSKWWFRIFFLWPHFPGEDWVPDYSPLASECLPEYRGKEPVTELTI